MSIQHTVIAIALLAGPGMVFAWPFDKASDEYRQAVYELQCCFSTDSNAQSPSQGDCPKVSADADAEELRANHLCQWTDKQAQASDCNYDEVYNSVIDKRALCLQEFTDAQCGAARKQGINDAHEKCGN